MAETVQSRITWPLIFTYRGNVFGQGYIASVSAVSRVLGIQEEVGIWLSGVQPGGIAAGGQDLWEARVTFQQAFVGVLADIASSVGDFPAFQAEVARFPGGTRRSGHLRSGLRRWMPTAESRSIGRR